MPELKEVTAANIRKLRTDAGLTQAEFAERLNYSDKSVSKWERAESLPDICVLKQIADMLGVTVDFLITEHPETDYILRERSGMTRNRQLITGISLAGVVLIAMAVYFFPWVSGKHFWLAFVIAVPVGAIVFLVLNSIWGRKKYNVYAVAVIIWGTLLSIYLAVGNNLWFLFILGLPMQAAAVMGFRIKIRSKTSR